MNQNRKMAILEILVFMLFLFFGCENQSQKQSEIQKVDAVLQKHLNSVSTRDLASLKETLSPGGEMELILPGREITTSTASFIEMHEEWFKEGNWTFEWKILSTDVGKEMSIATAEIMYKEPERNGKPYFNRMIVGYGLRKENENWYVIKDQACSMEKSE